MKYTFHNELIPQEARQELNDKILYLVEQDLAEQSGISREDIYNAFMKGQDVDLDEIYTRFGVDYDLMGLLMSRDMDKEGRFYISWGEQKVS